MLYSYFFNMLKVGVPGFTQVPQLLVYNHKSALSLRTAERVWCELAALERVSEIYYNGYRWFDMMFAPWIENMTFTEKRINR